MAASRVTKAEGEVAEATAKVVEATPMQRMPQRLRALLRPKARAAGKRVVEAAVGEAAQPRIHR